MALEPEEKLWLDRDLWQIPVLVCGAKDPDYTAIMSRFHQLLLKKDPETHEELIKYWAFLIVTAPDAFEGNPNKRYKQLIFSEVQETAIKLNRPIEEIELTPGHPKLGQADNSRCQNLEPIRKVKLSKVKMDDLQLFRWYTDPANSMAARAFFGVYCLLLLGAYTKPSSLVDFCGQIYRSDERYDKYEYLNLYRGPKPPCQISINSATASFLRHAFQSQIETYRKVVRILLDWYGYHLERNSDGGPLRRRFFHRYVQPNLIYYGLSGLNLATSANEYWPKLESELANKGSEELMKSFRTIVNYLDSMRLQDDGTYLRQRLQLMGKNCRFWPYSRLFSPLYFKSVADDNHRALLNSCMDYKGIGKEGYISFCGLENYIDDQATKEAVDKICQEMDEMIKLGGDQRGLNSCLHSMQPNEIQLKFNES